jgi:hypothetical protein
LFVKGFRYLISDIFFVSAATMGPLEASNWSHLTGLCMFLALIRKERISLLIYKRIIIQTLALCTICMLYHPIGMDHLKIESNKFRHNISKHILVL